MVKRKMFKKVQLMKNQGRSMICIAKELGINRRTVSKYYHMSVAEYKEYEKSMTARGRLLDSYEEDIVQIYRAHNFRKLNMTSVFDYIEEKHGTMPCTEKSFRNFINSLIKKGTLVLKENVRLFDQVPPLPFGKQMQLDFGQFKFASNLKVYIFAAVLSASRFKFVALQNRPFKTIDVIRHLLDCFEYIGGIPEEIVIDQDATLVVSENSGDIVFTREFSEFLDEMKLKMYVCRKADPQSKGKVENLVGYVKKSFLEIRNYNEFHEASDDLWAWLIRRANGKISQATGLIPSEVILEERNHLRPLRNSIFKESESLLRDKRTPNKHSFISFQGSSYSIPKQYRNQIVEVFSHSERLCVYDCNGETIAEHQLALIPGQKVVDRKHFRETEKKSSELKTEVMNMFSMPAWQSFVTENFRHFTRYVRDQCILARKYFGEIQDKELLLSAITYCLENGIYSFKDLHESYLRLSADNVPCNPEPPILSSIKVPSVNVSKREISEYQTRANLEASL
ncbi:MAG: IS21 family transposase [Desulfobacteraceae bacterium]|nr:IS21 family transposase [Desulfobacteraceae bacterium]